MAKPTKEDVQAGFSALDAAISARAFAKDTARASAKIALDAKATADTDAAAFTQAAQGVADARQQLDQLLNDYSADTDDTGSMRANQARISRR